MIGGTACGRMYLPAIRAVRARTRKTRLHFGSARVRQRLERRVGADWANLRGLGASGLARQVNRWSSESARSPRIYADFILFWISASDGRKYSTVDRSRRSDAVSGIDRRFDSPVSAKIRAKMSLPCPRLTGLISVVRELPYRRNRREIRPYRFLQRCANSGGALHVPVGVDWTAGAAAIAFTATRPARELVQRARVPRTSICANGPLGPVA